LKKAYQRLSSKWKRDYEKFSPILEKDHHEFCLKIEENLGILSLKMGENCYLTFESRWGGTLPQPPSRAATENERQ
jgi:hypothetical protein